MPLVDRLSPALTTVRVQHYKAGFEAAGIIVDIIENGARRAASSRAAGRAVVRNSTTRGARAPPQQNDRSEQENAA